MTKCKCVPLVEEKGSYQCKITSLSVCNSHKAIVWLSMITAIYTFMVLFGVFVPIRPFGFATT